LEKNQWRIKSIEEIKRVPISSRDPALQAEIIMSSMTRPEDIQEGQTGEARD